MSRKASNVEEATNSYLQYESLIGPDIFGRKTIPKAFPEDGDTEDEPPETAGNASP